MSRTGSILFGAAFARLPLNATPEAPGGSRGGAARAKRNDAVWEIGRMVMGRVIPVAAARGFRGIADRGSLCAEQDYDRRLCLSPGLRKTGFSLSCPLAGSVQFFDRLTVQI